VVVGAEELDWVTADAFHLFSRRVVLSGGAGALRLSRAETPGTAVILDAVTSSHLFVSGGSASKPAREANPRERAAAHLRAELPRGDSTMLLCDGTQNAGRYDAAEIHAWKDWPGVRLSPKSILGEGLPAAAAWQCVAAVDALQRGRAQAANVSVVGCNQQAIGAHFRVGPIA
jgi:3-oxoacyl-(acyl-carrier-protein) synthase